MSSALVAILSDCIVLCQRDVDGLLWSTGAAAAVVAVVVAAAPPPLDAMDAMVKKMCAIRRGVTMLDFKQNLSSDRTGIMTSLRKGKKKKNCMLLCRGKILNYTSCL
jgi:hypothetical protein